ncbi:MAG: DUF2917 domain-containing protein [Variovorax sp.]
MSATLSPSSSLSSLPLPSAAVVPPAVRRGAWQIAAGQAMTLKARSESVLRVRQGRLWVTCNATAQWGSEDLVLAPGESLVVAAGQQLVMEPWDSFGATYSWDASADAAA